jgi:hypothetical protein
MYNYALPRIYFDLNWKRRSSKKVLIENTGSPKSIELEISTPTIPESTFEVISETPVPSPDTPNSPAKRSKKKSKRSE